MPGFYQPGEYDVSGTVVARWLRNPKCSMAKDHSPQRHRVGHAASRSAHGWPIRWPANFFEPVEDESEDARAGVEEHDGDEL